MPTQNDVVLNKHGLLTPDVLRGPWGFGGLFYEFAQDNITATAGGGQTNAFPIVGQTSRITTVTTAGDSILLPVSVAGLELLVVNHGANAMQVFGTGTDTIDDVAAATGVSHMSNSLVIYTCCTAGKWYSEGLATGYAGSGLQTLSYTDGLTAHAGGGQGSAVLLPSMINRVATVATIADSVILPNAKPGMVITAANGAANSMNVFPASGEQINALGANTAFAVAGNTISIFYSFTAAQWFTK